MKKLFVTTLTFVISNSILLAQDLSKINEKFNLSDSLTYSQEIRVYKLNSFTGTDIFRMYNDSSENWSAEFFKAYKKSIKSKKFRYKKYELNPKKELKTIWWDILKTNIEGLPDMSKITWKLKNRVEVVINKEGDKILTWGNFIGVNDGESYIVQLSFENKSKKIKYSNPFTYLSHHQDIDELIYFTEMIDIISSEFDIWKNN